MTEDLNNQRPKDDMERANELRDSFFANISHEFRTPLSVIAGMAELIRSDPAQWVESGTELIKMNSQDLLQLVNQILDLQKLEKKELKLNLIQADIVPFLIQRAGMFESLAKQKGIGYKVESSIHSLLMDFDPSRLLRILSNMVGNAIKFTDEGQVKVNILKVDEAGKEMLRLDIIDSGIGIKPKNQEKIFARFYQADTMQSKVGQGTGIGLELVQDMVTLMGGHIRLKSATGVGTHFMVSIPITRKAPLKEIDDKISPKVLIPPSLKKLEDTLAYSNHGPRLLIIEDNLDVQLMLIGQLSDEYEIHLAENGAKGVDMAIELVPDIIMSDVMMPYKDGYQVVDELKNHKATSHIPILLLTSKDDSESRLKGLKRGADAYVGKPYELEELKIRLTNLLVMRDRLIHHFSDGKRINSRSNETDLRPEEEFIDLLQKLLEEHLDETDFGISEICKGMGVSRTQLHNKLTALTGLSASRYIRKLRLAKSKEILDGTELSISEIAYATGFAQPSYFSNSFKAEYGMSPSEYRSDS